MNGGRQRSRRGPGPGIEAPGAGARPRPGNGALRAAVLGLALLAGTTGPAAAQYLAVFVDGRLLKIRSATIVDRSRIRLDLRDGGSIEVPLTRLDRVIADEIEAKPKPIPPPACAAGYTPVPLPAGTPFAAEIEAASRAANLAPALVAAVVGTESAFKPWAVSPVGAAGLMQLMPSVWLEQRIASPYEPAANLRAGCRHLRTLIDRFGDLTLALAAYNAGIATVARDGSVPAYHETREFVRRVLAKFCPPAPAAGAG
jgi:Transglycosylase SLT domain